MWKRRIQQNMVLASIVCFLTLFLWIQQMHPSFLYQSDGSLRQFGIGFKKTKTILPIWLLSICLGIIVYITLMYWIHYCP